MSLWQVEVEKSQFSPDSITRKKKPGVLERFLAGGRPDKPTQSKFKYDSASHSGIEQYDFPERLQHEAKVRQYMQPALAKSPRVLNTESDPTCNAPTQDRQRVFVKTADALKLRNKPLIKTASPRRRPNTPEGPASRANVDHVANLIMEKGRLEQEIKEREVRYQYLLTESKKLTQLMCIERDFARQELETLRHANKPSALKDTSSPRGRYAQEELEHLFQPHDEFYFKHSFTQLEKTIRKYVLNALMTQPAMLQMSDLNPSMDFYVQKHNLQPLTVFGIRDLRCIVCRGFIMEFLLERVFRVFLFGMPQGQTFKEGFQALSAIDIGQGSRWASAVAKVFIASSSDYNPEKAAIELLTELTAYLSAFIDIDQSSGLEQVVDKAIDLARDCRLDVSSFSLDMPGFGTTFDPQKMDAAKVEQGNVAITYAPTVSRRGNRRGQQYEVSFVILKAKVWRESVFSELHHIIADLSTIDDEEESM